MAITEMAGNRRRTTESSSKPDICGIFRSEINTEGRDLFNCNRASNPCTAILTLYPEAFSNITIVLRTAVSSSTTKISCGGGGSFAFLFICDNSKRPHNHDIQQLAKLFPMEQFLLKSVPIEQFCLETIS